MGREVLMMFVGSDDVLEIPKAKESPKPVPAPRPMPKPKPEPRERTSKVIRLSAEAYAMISAAATELRVPLARVVDCMVEHFAKDPGSYKAFLSRFEL